MSTKGKTAAIKSATSFFGAKRCILTEQNKQVDWHHLDENSSNWIAQNIIPLGSGFNQEIERTRKDRFLRVSVELDPQVLLVKGARLFERGLFSASYGVSRLGCFLSTRLEVTPETRLNLAAGALISLRSIPDSAFISDTLKRSVLPLLRSPESKEIGRFARFRVALEIAALWRDFGGYSQSVSILDSKAALPDLSEGKRSIHPSRAGHCRATNLMKLHPSDAENVLRQAQGQAEQIGFAFGVSNAKVSLVESALINGHLDLAEERLNEVVSFCGGYENIKSQYSSQSLEKCSWWMASEILGLAADLARRQGHSELANDNANHAIKILIATRIRPRADAVKRLALAYGAVLPSSLYAPERTFEELESLSKLFDEVITLLAADVS